MRKMKNKFTITRKDILENFNVSELDNPITMMTIQEALVKADSKLPSPKYFFCLVRRCTNTKKKERSKLIFKVN